MEKLANPTILSWSGGKDSALALNELQHNPDYCITKLLTTITEDYARVSIHGVRTTLLEMQADSLGYPVDKVLLPANCSYGEYEKLFGKCLEDQRSHGITSIAFGDLFLEDVRKYRQKQVNVIGMDAVFPLWGKNTKSLARHFITTGFKAVVVCVDTDVLAADFSGRDYNIEFLHDLPAKVDPCGENGEFHTFVYDGPLFQYPIRFSRGEVVLRENRFQYCDLISG